MTITTTFSKRNARPFYQYSTETLESIIFSDNQIPCEVAFKLGIEFVCREFSFNELERQERIRKEY